MVMKIAKHGEFIEWLVGQKTVIVHGHLLVI